MTNQYRSRDIEPRYDGYDTPDQRSGSREVAIRPGFAEDITQFAPIAHAADLMFGMDPYAPGAEFTRRRRVSRETTDTGSQLQGLEESFSYSNADGSQVEVTTFRTQEMGADGYPNKRVDETFIRSYRGFPEPPQSSSQSGGWFRR